jgi:hypothetical protein
MYHEQPIFSFSKRTLFIPKVNLFLVWLLLLETSVGVIVDVGVYTLNSLSLPLPVGVSCFGIKP